MHDKTTTAEQPRVIAEASGAGDDLGLPVLLESDDILDVVPFAVLKKFHACVAEIAEQTEVPPTFVELEAAGIVFTCGRQSIIDRGADSNRETLVQLDAFWTGLSRRYVANVNSLEAVA